MKRAALALLAILALGSCARADHKTHIYLQRFFGECGAEYGSSTDVGRAEGECGIITTLINRFNAENPDIHVDVNVVAWPGYPQLTAQVAARDPPDLVTMHEGVISDYAVKGLVEPVDGYLRMAGISPSDFTDASRAGVTIGNHYFGLPWDTHGGLFHVNTALFAKAGLMRGGKAILPNSPVELIASMLGHSANREASPNHGSFNSVRGFDALRGLAASRFSISALHCAITSATDLRSALTSRFFRS